MIMIIVGIALIVMFILGYALGRVDTMIRYKKKALALLAECQKKGLSSTICGLVEKHFSGYK